MLSSFIFTDTSGWYAILDRTDDNHPAAKAFLNPLQAPLITTNLIIHETITLVNHRLGHDEAVRIGRKLWSEDIARLFYVTPEIEKLSWDYFQRFRDKSYSFVDCTSFIVMKNLGMTQAFTFDDHFRQAGFSKLPFIK